MFTCSSALAEKGHKSQKTNYNLAKTVHYLVCDLSKERKTLSPERLKPIQIYPRSLTKHQLVRFLGLTEYYRQ